MLVLIAAWAALSLLVGLAVVKTIRRADIPAVPSPPPGRWVTPTNPLPPATGNAAPAPSGTGKPIPSPTATFRTPTA